MKLYPEGNAGTRFKTGGVREILFYCNRDGLFRSDVIKGIDDKRSAYDDAKERMELEKAAGRLFGSSKETDSRQPFSGKPAQL